MTRLLGYAGILAQLLFGCTHNGLSRVFTIRRHSYKVCLDCGREFPYSLTNMQIVRPSKEVGGEKVESVA